jgi:hypothetical protein
MEHGISQYGCVHALPGRLRVRVPAIKKSPEVAARIEQTLRQHEAVVNVAASPVTGSVLVLSSPRLPCWRTSSRMAFPPIRTLPVRCPIFQTSSARP